MDSVFFQRSLFLPWRVGRSSHASRVLVFDWLLPVFHGGTQAHMIVPHELWLEQAVV